MKTLPTLLLVEDDPEIRDQMKWALASDYELWRPRIVLQRSV